MGKEMVRADSAAARELERLRSQQFFFALHMVEKDLKPTDLCRKLANGDPVKAKKWRARYRKWCTDPDFHKMIAELVSGSMWMSLPQVTNALIRRAVKGNVPAMKLLMEATGYYSPRSQVDHTGEIAITLKGLSRPPAVQDDEPIVEATVVE